MSQFPEGKIGAVVFSCWKGFARMWPERVGLANERVIRIAKRRGESKV